MTRQPGAFLALWNSISSPALQPEYETWHTMEHVPERVGLPGFIEARRYRSWEPTANGTPLYFTCYWLDSLDALDSAPYRDVFTYPTPWSARMRTGLTDFFRLPCRLGGVVGPSSASQLCTLHLHGDAAVMAAALEAALNALVARAAVVSAQWGWVSASGDFPIANRATLDTSTEQGSEAVVLLQGLDRSTLSSSATQLVATLAPVAAQVSPPAFFELLSQVRQDALAPATTPPAAEAQPLQSPPTYTRQPAKTALFSSFTPGDTP